MIAIYPLKIVITNAKFFNDYSFFLISIILVDLTPGSRRRAPIPSLPIPISIQPKPQRNAETEKRLRSLRTGSLKINGVPYETNINDLEYLSELGNGTSGHVVKMKHKPSGAIIAVKQMRRTGNDEETKR